MKVLVIEDHPAELKLAHHVLSAAGYKVNEAKAAEQAFAAIQDDRPQVILLDLSLPGMDGLTLVHRLKADPATRDIHVIAITSFPEKYSKADALAAGCDAYLVKPFSTRDLPTQVSAVVGRGRESQA
ncbi:response regulator receiver protein [Chthoniobacter flavus Ellin428]|uniref:Response regulator receiver protein n=1 Tax=Chthoniobacter flavus Ellin428 TaxID=497964 RepID=B4D6V5_9BACT|nr:response regulator [Chthoniobacter flavus]EDY17906.1 response regulator receiver protein [Chthoniobacter flavus Ellin428]TCO88513.1 two-component system cell cycle response regulator DivK [Chthoniobacter flavus]